VSFTVDKLHNLVSRDHDHRQWSHMAGHVVTKFKILHLSILELLHTTDNAFAATEHELHHVKFV